MPSMVILEEKEPYEKERNLHKYKEPPTIVWPNKELRHY